MFAVVSIRIPTARRVLPAVGASSESTVSSEEVGGHALALLRLFFTNQKYPVGFTTWRLDRDSAHCCFPSPRPDAGGKNQETGGRLYSAAGWENETSPHVCGQGRQTELKFLCLFHVFLMSDFAPVV